MFRLVIYWRQRARFPRPVAPSAGASHTHTASYNYSHSHRLEHLRFLRGSLRDLRSRRTQHGNTAGYVRGKQVARMTSLFLRAVASLRSAAQSAAAQAAQPAPVPAAPVVWDKRNEEELKRIIPLSFSCTSASALRHKDKDHHRGRDRPTTGQSMGMARRFAPTETCPERDKFGQTRPCDDRSYTPTSIHTEHGCVTPRRDTALIVC
jgi:hypothetical protein